MISSDIIVRLGMQFRRSVATVTLPIGVITDVIAPDPSRWYLLILPKDGNTDRTTFREMGGSGLVFLQDKLTPIYEWKCRDSPITVTMGLTAESSVGGGCVVITESVIR